MMNQHNKAKIMKQYENLYALDKKGKIRVFKSSYNIQNDGRYIIQTRTGLLNGKLTDNYTTISFGRAGRTVEEQCIQAIEAKIKEKQDEGYKNFSWLRDRFYFKENSITTQKVFEDEKTVQALYSKLGIKWNTSKSETPLPMLAETYKEGKYKFPMLCQRKYAGVRCLAIKIKGKILLCSRGGQFYVGLTQIEDEVSEVLRWWFDSTGQHIALDGELYAHGYPESRVSGTARRVNRGLYDDHNWLEYHVYDLAIPKMIQRDRAYHLKTMELESMIANLKYVKIVPTYNVSSHEEAIALHDKFVMEGYEGAILRQLDKTYMFGFRDNALLKVKKFMTKSYKIYDFEVDDNIGIESFKFICVTKDGQLFGVRPIGSHELWKEYVLNFKNIEGKMAKIKFFNYSVNGIPEKANLKSIEGYE